MDAHAITCASWNMLKAQLEAGAISSLQIVRAFRNVYEEDTRSASPLGALVEFFSDAEEHARTADNLRASCAQSTKTAGANGGSVSGKPLLGLPFAVKDNISVKGKHCTCGSKLLADYRAPYDATVVARLRAAGAIPLGRTNMDEFAMGSSTEYSVYGPTRNPRDRSRTSGGSSGGSAAAVAGGQAPFALGTETGGSVRLPAAYCGLYGLKPTYGLLSRYGVVAFGSSLDQIGFFATCIDDIALALSVTSGKDLYDSTSTCPPPATGRHAVSHHLAPFSAHECSILRAAVPRELVDAPGVHPDVSAQFQRFLTWLRAQNVQVEEVTLPALQAAVPVYYLVATAEAASNLARFDGIRYGQRGDTDALLENYYRAVRTSGFGPEVQRRIIVGNYVLSRHFSGDYYRTSVRVRSRIEQECTQLLCSYHFIVCPTAATGAFPLGERIHDPLAMYCSDLFTTFVNLARLPALSVPVGTSGTGLPIGIQIIGSQWQECAVLRLAKRWEETPHV
ncbi:Asp-tRNA(Asn)/Glu-tRNA(Gln) amidotransferase subunit GatA [Treponema pallidum]|nr:Asp-tRNA(Asn)/Glu-tRNA(Gln) amidotransferase subunit GatA [Treponema pallidum]QUJ84584.1 Asp-tRNA(Asn)/Glu-tRNA(Gln) amidotransferase subunit GatA [Treponema pallidum]QUK39046.1 Asp-tRNA(Asn)/Glu-tRNA(Gln) amidotransferase subunit GatA [Treponema pallidum]